MTEGNWADCTARVFDIDEVREEKWDEQPNPSSPFVFGNTIQAEPNGLDVACRRRGAQRQAKAKSRRQRCDAGNVPGCARCAQARQVLSACVFGKGTRAGISTATGANRARVTSEFRSFGFTREVYLTFELSRRCFAVKLSCNARQRTKNPVGLNERLGLPRATRVGFDDGKRSSHQGSDG